ncbi:membrane protein [Xylanibacillus composti]|uniref:Membrane protein n=1 Tax=Xylanibacillus composti TaxID=1572762 RepID=A0A8J4H4U5_9BACL|nr:ABC transporter permease [Xylanibacillus composti]GIQ69641.1 membrane protein [Xylanibacillus composti]
MGAYICSQLRSRLVRTLSVVIGISMGTGLFLALSALGNGYQQAARLPLSGLASDIVVSKSADSTSAASQITRGIRMPFGIEAITEEERAQIAEQPSIDTLTGVLLLWDFDRSGYKTILGVDTSEHASGPAYVLEEGIVKGRSFSSTDRGVAVVDRHYAAFYNLQPGSELLVGDQTFQVVGTVSQSNTNQTAAANVYIPLADARMLAGLEQDEVNQLYIRVADASRMEEITREIGYLLPHAHVVTEDSLIQVMGGIGKVSAQFAKAAAAVGLVGGVLLAWFALQGMMAERRKEIAIMKALGWRKREIYKLFLLETALLGGIGLLAGLVLGWGSMHAVQLLPMPDIPLAGIAHELDSLNQVHTSQQSAALPAYLDTATILLASIAVGISVLAAGWSSAAKVLRMKPAALLRNQ